MSSSDCRNWSVSDMPGNNWKNIGPLANIPVRGSRRLCLKQKGRPVAVFRTGDDEIFALIDECPHKKGPLSEGIISGNTVTCPLHNWVIGLEDGKALAPDEGTTQSIAVRVIDGDIYVHLPELVTGVRV
jgi:nitrite reductase (NADH) small subunit